MERSQEERRDEVIAWRASGMTLARFAKGRGYSKSSLEKWARAEREGKLAVAEPKFVRLAIERSPSDLLVEVGAARIRVSRGFDPTLLSEIVSALGASS